MIDEADGDQRLRNVERDLSRLAALIEVVEIQDHRP